MKYIEEQLAKRKGLIKEEDESNKYLTPEEIAFSSVPEYLRMKSTVQSEEMLSNQMLSGIPEVDLGIEYDNFSYFLLLLCFSFKTCFFLQGKNKKY